MKKRVSPITTALVLIVVIGVVLGLYTRGLLGGKKGEEGGGGGGGAGAEPVPPTGLPTVAVTTFVGWSGPGLADGTGWDAEFNGPSGIAVAADGSLYVADSRNHRLRRITPDGTVTTVAGAGPVDCMPGGFADGPADRARLFNPTGIAVASDGIVYFADTGNHRIRALKDGVVTTVAGGPTEADDLGFEQGGYQDGPAAEARFRSPGDVAIEPTGGILVADLGNNALRRVAADGSVSTVRSGGQLKSPTGLVFFGASSFAVADPGAGVLLETIALPKLSGRARAGIASKRPTGVCPLGEGALAVADAEWNAVFGVTPTRSVLLAGVLPPTPVLGHTDGTGAEARFFRPCAVVYANSKLYVADFGNNCIRALTIPPDWAIPPVEDDEAQIRRERRRRWRQRESDGAENRDQRPGEDVRRWRPGAQTD